MLEGAAAAYITYIALDYVGCITHGTSLCVWAQRLRSACVATRREPNAGAVERRTDRYEAAQRELGTRRGDSEAGWPFASGGL